MTRLFAVQLHVQLQLHEGSVTRGLSCNGVQLHCGSAARWLSDTEVQLHGSSVTTFQLLGVQLHGGSIALEPSPSVGSTGAYTSIINSLNFIVIK